MGVRVFVTDPVSWGRPDIDSDGVSHHPILTLMGEVEEVASDSFADNPWDCQPSKAGDAGHLRRSDPGGFALTGAHSSFLLLSS